MIMKKVLVLLIISLVVLGSSTLFANGQDESASGKPVVLKLGHTGSPTHHYQVTAEKFKSIVEEKTGGQIQVNIFPSSQLGTHPEMIESTKIGTQEMGIFADALLANHAPDFNVLGLPYNFESYDQVEKLPGSSVAVALETALEEENMVILGWCANGFRLTTSSKPVYTVDDMKGLKIRIGSADLISRLETALGATPVPMSMSETYTGLQTGTVDGQENPTSNILSSKLYEVQDYLVLTRHQYVAQPLVINKDVFDSLSPEYQQILKDAGKEVAAADVQMVKDSEAKEIKELESLGMTVIEPELSGFKAKLAPLYAYYDDKYGADWIALEEKFAELK